MIKKITIYICVVLLGVGLATAAGADSGEETTVEKTGTEALKKKCKKRLIAAPIIFYTPETRLAFGAAGSLVFRMAGCGKETRPSAISSVFIYTQEKQFQAQLKTELYFKNNDYRLELEVKTDKYPNKFYGIGSSTLEENEELYTSKSTNLFFSLQKKLSKGFNVGVLYHWNRWDIVETEETGLLSSGLIPGSIDGTMSGVGVLANRDTRDNLYFPSKGDFFTLEARLYPKFLGSTYGFNTFTVDLRKYISVFSNHVLAFQSLLKVQGGDVPFLHLARMGGQYTMRGYYDGRFRDKNLLVFQADYRVPLFWRFGVVAFAGAGKVAPKFNRLTKDLGDMITSYGFGIRFLFDRKENIWLRFDVAFGEGVSGFYFSIFEAF